jgi:hypothetical protein
VGHDVDIRPCTPAAVRIGGVDKPGLLHSLRRHGVQLNRAADALFQHPHFTTLGQPHLVDIASLSVAALGFSEGATYRQVTARAIEAGLTECPLELGPHLRTQFPDQHEAPTTASAPIRGAPHGSITIASRPLDDAELTPKGFYLRRLGDVLWLRGYWSPAEHVWAASDVFVFSRGLTAI